MTGTPSNVPGRRRFPVIDSADLDLLAKAARSPKRKPLGGVVAHDWRDPDGDERVFAAVFAVQHIDRQPWLVRGVLRTGASGPPVLSRVAIEHFHDPGREVTGTVLRDLRFGEIRDRALTRLRDRADNLGAMSFVPEARAAPAAEAAKKAGRGRISIDSRGAYPLEHYRHIAERYLALVASGRRDVLKALSEEEGKRLGEPIGHERMRDWVRKATRLGYLGSGTPGSVSRQPGPELLCELEQLEGGTDG
jgi:hypothetical protein